MPAGAGGGADSAAARDAPADGAAPAPSASPAVVEGPPPPRNGSRFHLWHRRTPEGSPGSFRWRDTQLDAFVNPVRAEDGTFRMVPDALSDNGNAFADAACTVPAYVLRSATCVPPPTYLRRRTAPATVCPAGERIRKLGAKRSERHYYERPASGGACSTYRVLLGETDQLHDLGEEVPATAFPQATLRTEAPVRGLAATFLETEDGARAFYAIRDVATGGHYADDRAADGKRRLFPIGSAPILGYHADAACSVPVGSALPSSCPAERAFVSRYSNECNARRSLFRAGASVAEVHSGSSAACRPAMNTGRDHYLVGVEVDPSTLLEATRGILDVPGRLKPQAVSTAAGRYVTGTFWDASLAAVCSFWRLHDGTERCLPSNTTSSISFADDQCTRRVAAIYAPGCLPAFATAAIPDTCPTRYRVLRATSEMHRGKVYARSATSGACVELGGTMTDTHQVLGDEVDPAEFGEVLPAAP